MLRSAFRQLAPTQWQAFVQQVSYGMGYGGNVSNVEVEKLEDIEQPFHYGYDYTRKNYSGWAEHKITPPLPALSFGRDAEGDKPKEPFWAGAPGTITYSASVQLPKGFTAALPSDNKLTSAFADYSSHYSVKNGVLVAERKMTIKQAKISLDQWAAYQKFSNDLQADQSAFILLSEIAGSSAGAPSADNPAADRLMEQVGAAMKARNVKEIQNLLAQVERLNSKQPKLWAIYGFLAMRSGKFDEAVADCQKEIQFHPDETIAYQELASALMYGGRRAEAIDAEKKALALEPQNESIGGQLATLLLDAKRYGEVPAVLEKPIAAAPNNYRLRTLRAKALLHAGKQEEAIGEMKTIAAASSDPYVLNELAYALCDTGSALNVAEEWAQKAIDETEQDAAKTSLADVGTKDLAVVNTLIAEWDTLGWVYFRQNKAAKAEVYVKAAWQWGQHANVADHLAQIYERQGQRSAAVRMWRLALVADSKNEEARQGLQKAGISAVERPATNGRKSTNAPISAAEEFGTLRTIKVPGLPVQTGSAEFFLLIGTDGIEDVRLIGEADKFKDAGHAIKAAQYAWAFPDSGPEEIVRRGILSCSTYTHPSCELTMLLPSSTNLDGVLSRPTDHKDITSSATAVVPPTVLTKVEPEYSKEALEARAEGTVRLSIVISETGIPENVTVVHPLGMGLDEKARECVLKWRFHPAMREGKPVRSDAAVEVNFRLQKEAH